MTSSTVSEVLPASLVAVIVKVPSKPLVRPERVRLSRSLLNTPMRLEKVVVRRLVGMLKLFSFKSLKVHWMFSVCTSGEASEMVKVKVTLLSWIPTTLPWTACTVGGTEEEEEEEEEMEEEEEEEHHDTHMTAALRCVMWSAGG